MLDAPYEKHDRKRSKAWPCSLIRILLRGSVSGSVLSSRYMIPINALLERDQACRAMT
jgi:hypothetical protein